MADEAIANNSFLKRVYDGPGGDKKNKKKQHILENYITFPKTRQCFRKYNNI